MYTLSVNYAYVDHFISLIGLTSFLNSYLPRFFDKSCQVSIQIYFDCEDDLF